MNCVVTCPDCRQQRTVSQQMQSYIRRGVCSGRCKSCADNRRRSRPGRAKRPVCVHCGTRSQSRPRGLCWPCYYTPGVRERYPQSGKAYRSPVTSGYGTYALAAEPTVYRPGTPEKMVVMSERAMAGCAIFHPLDIQQEESHEEHRDRVRRARLARAV